MFRRDGVESKTYNTIDQPFNTADTKFIEIMGRTKGSKNRKKDDNKPKLDIVSMLSRINPYEKEKDSSGETYPPAVTAEHTANVNMDTAEDAIMIASNAVQLESKGKENSESSNGENPPTETTVTSANPGENETSESSTWSTLPDSGKRENPSNRLRLKPSFSDKARSRLHKATKVAKKSTTTTKKVYMNELGEIVPIPKKPIGRPRKHPKKVDENGNPIAKGPNGRPKKTPLPADKNGAKV
ncbi:unnamed protein product [Ambrosiozyma monospora]|uniref:Unnamed protein product n=1 Tax=Ambrosiozyma monospora TaxID=43982 RepID=A0ACB5SZ35_AMBMO|nr:unnamed protein product [Ambrosiozyma monospora]